MKVIAFNKPFEVLTKFTDSEGRPTLADFIQVPGIYAAGRLDRDSEGLLLLTDDGGMQSRIADPTHRLIKVYWAQVERVPDDSALRALREGVILDGRKTLPAEAALLPGEPALPPRSTPIRYRKNIPTAWVEIRLREGRNRQVRRMTAAVGFPTLRLVRVAIGPITLEGLAPGQWRELNDREIAAIRKITRG